MSTIDIQMKITVGQIREIVRKSLAGSDPNEAYSEDLLDDEAFAKKSMYVPDDVKDKIKKWAKSMKLSK